MTDITPGLWVPWSKYSSRVMRVKEAKVACRWPAKAFLRAAGYPGERTDDKREESPLPLNMDSAEEVAFPWELGMNSLGLW